MPKFDIKPLNELLQNFDMTRYQTFLDGLVANRAIDKRFIKIGNESYTLLGYVAAQEHFEAFKATLEKANPNILTQGKFGQKDWAVLGNVLSWQGRNKIPTKKIEAALELLKIKGASMESIGCTMTAMTIAEKSGTALIALKHGISPRIDSGKKVKHEILDKALSDLTSEVAKNHDLLEFLHEETTKIVTARLKEKNLLHTHEKAQLAGANTELSPIDSGNDSDTITAPASTNAPPPPEPAQEEIVAADSDVLRHLVSMEEIEKGQISSIQTSHESEPTPLPRPATPPYKISAPLESAQEGTASSNQAAASSDPLLDALDDFIQIQADGTYKEEDDEDDWVQDFQCAKKYSEEMGLLGWVKGEFSDDEWDLVGESHPPDNEG